MGRRPASGHTVRVRSTVVLRCVDLDANVSFFVDRLGFRVQLVRPADDPRSVVVDDGTLALELRRDESDEPAELVVAATGDVGADGSLVAPNGTTVSFHPPVGNSPGDVDLPPSRPSLTVVGADDGDFGLGRAGMEYRDLLPDRWGGRFIASHITIADGGDVADWVHFHRIRFQMIFVAAGWVDLVYEDQGDPFRAEAGDCILQPPGIRHRVLRSSPGLEVIEIGCPAEHDTMADHDLVLPTGRVDALRDFDGQRFVRHVASATEAMPWILDGWSRRDTGIGEATDGLAGVVVLGAPPGGTDRSAVSAPVTHDDEFVLLVGLRGRANIRIEGADEVEMTPRSSIALPPGTVWRWSDTSADHEALLVSLGADAVHAA